MRLALVFSQTSGASLRSCEDIDGNTLTGSSTCVERLALASQIGHVIRRVVGLLSLRQGGHWVCTHQFVQCADQLISAEIGKSRGGGEGRCRGGGLGRCGAAIRQPLGERVLVLELVACLTLCAQIKIAPLAIATESGASDAAVTAIARKRAYLLLVRDGLLYLLALARFQLLQGRWVVLQRLQAVGVYTCECAFRMRWQEPQASARAQTSQSAPGLHATKS
jgi:hypothetical protein